MSSATCEVFPPTIATIADGIKVYRCTGIVATINDTDADIFYNVDLILMDSLGHRVVTEQRDIVAPPGSASSGPFFADILADQFFSGDTVTFTGQIGVTAGFAGTDFKQSQVLIE
ncbi:hypothetical protein GCM10010520_55010 [Rhizobium viscosum]|uniref:Uncharacterized protein n=1 Tax=Rhizobium viscosum TaxID=1673 RepID=A0ABR9IZS0_RHIVS|nr:hypothetical protein [Rhizobium viscosum]MBE1508700.1 hypothetical protein [Rhizobium viscosum]